MGSQFESVGSQLTLDQFIHTFWQNKCIRLVMSTNYFVRKNIRGETHVYTFYVYGLTFQWRKKFQLNLPSREGQATIFEWLTRLWGPTDYHYLSGRTCDHQQCPQNVYDWAEEKYLSALEEEAAHEREWMGAKARILMTEACLGEITSKKSARSGWKSGKQTAHSIWRHFGGLLGLHLRQRQD